MCMWRAAQASAEKEQTEAAAATAVAALAAEEVAAAKEAEDVAAAAQAQKEAEIADKVCPFGASAAGVANQRALARVCVSF